MVSRPLDHKANSLTANVIPFEITIAEKLSKLEVWVFKIVNGRAHTICSMPAPSGAYLSPTAPGTSLTWKWDGYSTDGVLDTAELRGKLGVAIRATPEANCSASQQNIWLDNRAAIGKYVDVRIERPMPNGRNIGSVKADLYFNCSNLAATDHCMSQGIAWFLGGPLVGLWASKKAVDVIIPAAEMALVRECISDGLRAHWRRYSGMGAWDTTAGRWVPYVGGPPAGTAPRPCVDLEGTKYNFESVGRQRDSSDSVQFRALRPLDVAGHVVWDRGCNAGVVIPGMPIYLPVESGFNRKALAETCAHEFGHSILKDAFGSHWSEYHKETTGDAFHQDPIGPSAVDYPNPPSEIDLMKYYHKDPKPSDYWEDDPARAGWRRRTYTETGRTLATEDDVRALISVAAVEIRAGSPPK
jgi:hypothetical protein